MGAPWPPTGWEELTNDEDLVLARTWGERVVHLIRIESLYDDEDYPFRAELVEVDLEAIPQEVLDSVKGSTGMPEDHQLDDIELGWDCMMYGAYAPIGDILKVKRERQFRSKARQLAKISKDIEDHPAMREYYLGRLVNQIGSTAREYMSGDLGAAMKRLQGRDPAEVSEEMAQKAYCTSQANRKVNQSLLSSECWSVQIWGLHYCRTCDALGTEECGGVNIRKTGKNSNGHRIPLSESKADQDIRDGVIPT